MVGVKTRKKLQPEHPRISRGGSVHVDFETKKKMRENEKELRELELKSHGMHLDYVSNEGRGGIETTYLVPRINHFVETDVVKKYEDRVKLWIKKGYPIHIIGPTGCGKTTLAIKVAKDLGRPTVWINGDESVTTTDLVGGYSQVEAESLRDKYVHNVFKTHDILKADWVDNPLTLACKYGYTLVYNEFSRTKAAANNVLLSVLEENILELPTKFGEDRYVKVHPDFRVIFTSNNVEYAGVHKPQDALLDRLVGIHMGYYDSDTEVKIVKAHTKISIGESRRIVKVMRGLRERLDVAERPGTRACIMAAHGLEASNGASRDYLEQLCVDAIASKSSGFEDLENKRKIIAELLGD